MNTVELQRALTHLSPGQVAARYTLRGMHRLTGFRLWQGRCLTVQSARALPANSQVQFGFVPPERLQREAAQAGNGLEPHEVARWLKAGEECFGVFADGRLASYVWFSPGPAHLEGDVYVHFDRAFVYGRWAFTREECRGRHFHGLCMQQALAAYAARGRCGILSVVDAWNYSSLKAELRAGCVRAGWMMMTPHGVRTSAACRRLGMWLERAADTTG